MKIIHIILLLSLLAGFASCKKTQPPANAYVNDTAIGWFAGHENDAALFAEWYPVSADNPFIIGSFDELITQLKWGTGVIAFGFPACPRCRNAFPALEKVFKEMNMEQYAGLRGKILYYDIYDDREADNERYQTIVEYVKGFLQTDENDRPRIYSPDIFFVAAGTIMGNHLDTVPGLASPRDSLNEEQEAELLKIYKDLMAKIEDCEC